MDNENQTPQPPTEPTHGQPNGNTPPSSLPSSPLGTPGAPQQHPLDAPASAYTPPAPQPARSNVQEPEASPSALATIAGGFTSLVGAIFSWIIFPVAVVLILHNFVFQAYHVLGTSMMPTLHDSDYLIVSKLGYTEALIERGLGKNTAYIPARGQIIVFHYPKDPTKIFVKRVIGLPGDHIVIKNGTVTIYDTQHPNGFNPDTGFEPADTQTLIDTDEVVQPNNLFVMGDNRTPGGSYDSREWGELPSSYIIGDAVLRLLPLDEVRIL
jgi:signal peptidase I